MTEAFDREFGVTDLLPGPLLESVCGSLAGLLGTELAVLDPADRIVWGTLVPDAIRKSVVVELEPVAYLAAVVPPEQLQTAATLLREILMSRSRYLMASRLHVESIAADYAALLEKHAALQVSEARYKELSAELEQRVQAQVALLDERQRQIYKAETLASIGRLAAGVAHEINNPISFVRSNVATFSGYLQRIAELRKRLPEAAAAWRELNIDFVLQDGDELVRDSLGGIDRVARIVSDLKGFSNIDRPDEEVVDVNDNLRQVVAVLQGQLSADVKLDEEYGKLPRLLCLPGHLNQVFINIIRNAIQAILDQGQPGTVSVITQATEGGIRVIIRDSGIGMAAEQQEHAFDPFYTTREVGQGTGLGLTVARDIVQAHGGHIEILSRPAAGTTVTVFLPA
jgi:two-component system, NtrC family, sensor kinase